MEVILAETAGFCFGVKRAIELTKQTGIAPWVDVDQDKVFGIFTRLPEREEVVIPIEERLIVELYSK